MDEQLEGEGWARIGAAASHMQKQFAALPAEEWKKYESLAKEEGNVA